MGGGKDLLVLLLTQAVLDVGIPEMCNLTETYVKFELMSCFTRDNLFAFDLTPGCSGSGELVNSRPGSCNSPLE